MPRVSLAHVPTPLVRLDRLSAALAGPEIWVKRDDATGLALGGNKTRKLEFLVAAAQAAGCDTLVTVGKTQSNHARQTAAAAAAVGLECVLLLEQLAVEQLVVEMADGYESNGNVLLDRLFGATIETVRPEGNTPEAIDRRVGELAEAGRRPYSIPSGGSNGVGALGYVGAAFELADQLAEREVEADRIVVASGSAGTQAGLLVGLSELGPDVEVLGVSVSADAPTLADKVAEVADECAAVLDVGAVDRSRVVVDDGFVGPGYALPDERTMEAIELFARTEGVLLDPVYTGKAAACVVDGCRTGRFAVDERIVFLHTGGQPALFVYAERF